MELIATFNSHFKENPKIIVNAPGRINLLGEHVDYNMGPVLPAAIHLTVDLAAAPRFQTDIPRSAISLYAINYNETCTFHLDQLDKKVDIHGNPLPRWCLYPAGVAWALRNAGYYVSDAKIAYSSNIPIGAGLSSSAAVEVAFATMWQSLGGWKIDPVKLAQICQQAENEYVGVACGLMDQFASLCGVAGHALFFDTRDLSWEPAPLPKDSILVIADTGARRSLIQSEYNQRREACAQAVALLTKFLPHIHSLRDVKTTEFAAFGYFLPEIIRRRAEHVIKEIHRVHSAYNALLRQDKQAMGALMFAGHRSLRDLFEVSTPELDLLVDLAHGLPGIIGARLTGAGFGGCTINLVEAEYAEPFIAELSKGYSQATGKEVKIIQSYASRGAFSKEM